MAQWFEEFEEVVLDYECKYEYQSVIRCRSTMIDLGQIVSYADTTKMNKDPEDPSKSIIYLRSGRPIEVVEGYDTITDAIRRMNKANEEQCEVWLDELTKARKLRRDNSLFGKVVDCKGDK